MEDIVQIPRREFEAMKEKLSLFEDSEFMKKLSRLVDLLYAEKQGLYMGDDTSDLTTASLRNVFAEPNSPGIMYSQWEVVLVPFPYSDLSSSKRRPVLVVSNNDYNKDFSDILVCVITSNLSMDRYSVLLNDADLEIGKLPIESAIKCHKSFTIEKSQVLKRFSIVNEQKFTEVMQLIYQLIQIAR